MPQKGMPTSTVPHKWLLLTPLSSFQVNPDIYAAVCTLGKSPQHRDEELQGDEPCPGFYEAAPESLVPSLFRKVMITETNSSIASGAASAHENRSPEFTLDSPEANAARSVVSITG